MLYATEFGHLFMDSIKLVRLLALMRVTGFPLSTFDSRYVYINRRMKNLGLFSREYFKIIESFLSASVQPGIIDQKGSRTVVPVRIHRPVGEEDIRFLPIEDLRKLFIVLVRYFRIAIDLSGKDGTCFKNFTGLFNFRRANPRRLVM